MFLSYGASGVIVPPSGLNIVVKSIQADTALSGVLITISGTLGSFSEQMVGLSPIVTDIVFKTTENVMYTVSSGKAAINYIYVGDNVFRYTDALMKRQNDPSIQNWPTVVQSGSYGPVSGGFGG